MNAPEYLEVLNPEQYEAVTHENSPLLILAGAGSGKTRVITTKIAYLISQKGFDPRSILAVTFTKKAATEMAERARLLEPHAYHSQIRTFHSFGAWFLRMYANPAGLDSNFTVYDDDDMVTLLTKAVPVLSRQQASHAVHHISLAKDYCLLPNSPELVNISNDPEFPALYEAYQDRLAETGNVDFGDLIMLPVLIMQKNEQIRAQMHYRFKVVMVDEYQDSNVAQFMLLQQLSGEETYVCVVGDDDQSIYKFRGAEVQNILTFQDHFPGTKMIKLERNYRSKASILAVAGEVVKNNTGRLGKTLKAERGEGKKPTLVFLPTQDAETAFCAELIQKAHAKGCPYADWAILYRTNAQSLGFETEFLHRKIPYTVVGSLKFYEREEIKDILAFLALIANPKDEIAFRRIINKPTRGIGAVSQDKIVDAARSARQSGNDMLLGGEINLLEGCRSSIKSLSKKAQSGVQSFLDLMSSLLKEISLEKEDVANITDLGVQADLPQIEQTENTSLDLNSPRLALLIEKIAIKSGLVEYHNAQDEIAGTQRTSNIQELANSATLYPLSRKGLFDFLDHIELDRTLEFADDDDEKNRDAVTLITLHNTKGLEFSRVIITGLEKGIFPRNGKGDDELEEERRLFYVGVTRAKDELYVTSCGIRRMYGRTEYMEPSPFLYEISTESIDVLGKAPSVFARIRSGDNSYAVANGAKSELAQHWAKGVKLFHDDFGYGGIITTKGGLSPDGSEDDAYVIDVQFETGLVKQFMPKFQAHSLMIVKD